MTATINTKQIDVSDPRNLEQLINRMFQAKIVNTQDADFDPETFDGQMKLLAIEFDGMYAGGFRYKFRAYSECSGAVDLYLFPDDFESIEVLEPQLKEDAGWYLDSGKELDEAWQHLRSHRQTHAYGGHCGCGEYYEEEDGFGHVTIYRYPTLQEEASFIMRALRRFRRSVVELVSHRCTHKTDDTDSYYLPCPVCGSDGNA